MRYPVCHCLYAQVDAERSCHFKPQAMGDDRTLQKAKVWKYRSSTTSSSLTPPAS